MAALAELDHRRVALLGRQDDVEPVAVHPDERAACEQLLDVVEVVGVAGVRELHRGQVDALLVEEVHDLQPALGRRMGVGHDRPAGLQARLGHRAQDLLDVVGDPGLVDGALQEGRLDVRALDPLLDVVHEQADQVVDVAVEEVLRHERVAGAVDPGAEHVLDPRRLRDLDREPGVAADVQHRGIDDRLDAVLHRAAHLRDACLALARAVVEMRPLRPHALRRGQEMLVGEREPEVGRVDRAGDGVHGGHKTGTYR